MTKRKISLVLALSIILISLVSCATSFDTNAYKTLASAKVAYTQGMGAISDLQKQNKLTPAQTKTIWDIANAYYMAYLTAESAYEAYHVSKDTPTQDQLIAVLTALSNKLGELIGQLAVFGVTNVQPITVPAK